MHAMVRFSGPELLNRQRLQAAQKAQVTTKKKELEAVEKQFEQAIQDYENQIQSDRSAFIGVIRAIYSVAKTFKYNDPWIESLLLAYDKYVTDNSGQKVA